MAKCEYCGEEMVLPYHCSYCGRYFCVRHRLPENHDCINIPPRVPLKTKVAAEESVISKDELQFIEEPPIEKPKRNNTLRYLIPIFCLVLILASYGSYTLGYTRGYNGGYADGNLTGYAQGYSLGNSSSYELGFNDGYLKGVIDGAGRGFNIRDPTYQEMLDFIKKDQTDKNEYNESSYYCFHFAADVKLNAFKAGYRCGFVYIEGTIGAHAIVCFNTTDKGIIFIEPQTDEIVQVVIGEYYETEEFWVLIGRIKSYAIVW